MRAKVWPRLVSLNPSAHAPWDQPGWVGQGADGVEVALGGLGVLHPTPS